MSTATAIQQLTAEAAQVFDAAFDDFTSCSTGDRFATLNAMTEFALQHQAHLARFAQVLEHSGSALSSVAKDLRYSSTATLLQHEVGFAKGQADAYVRLGKLLQHREYPVLAAAIEAGTISSQQAIIITREFDRQRNHYDAEFIAVADRSAVSFCRGTKFEPALEPRGSARQHPRMVRPTRPRASRTAHRTAACPTVMQSVGARRRHDLRHCSAVGNGWCRGDAVPRRELVAAHAPFGARW